VVDLLPYTPATSTPVLDLKMPLFIRSDATVIGGEDIGDDL
jgi:hypothetical protein